MKCRTLASVQAIPIGVAAVAVTAASGVGSDKGILSRVMPTPSHPRRDGRRPELGPDLIELVQGGVHGLANRPDPIQLEPGSNEIRLDPQPLQRLRLRPI